MNTRIGDAPHLEALFPNQNFLSAWSTPEAFSRHVEELKENEAWHTSAWEKSDAQFYGTKTLAEALTLGKEGWKEGAEQVYKLRNRILASSPLIKRPVQYGIVGAVPSIPRAVAGNPLNMRIPDNATSKRKPVITIISDTSVNCTVDRTVISNRAAAVATIIDQIESAGFACEVFSAAHSTGNRYQATTLVIAKESSQPVDVSRLAFALGHVAFFRRLVFADWGGNKNNQQLGYGLGYIQAIDVSKIREKGYYFLSSAEGVAGFFENDERTETKGLPWLTNQLKSQGCPAFPLTREEKEARIKDDF